MTSPRRKERVVVTRSTSRRSSSVRPWKRSGAGVCPLLFVVAIGSPGGPQMRAGLFAFRGAESLTVIVHERRAPLCMGRAACVIEITDAAAHLGGYCVGARVFARRGGY